jgi:hypothetical protein|tara:strand:- start:2823 stop:3926 length:1104 start_codon:yes stop_codon:yes gene_type:complete
MSNENTTASTPSDDAGFYAGQDYDSLDDIPVPMGPMGAKLGLTTMEESLPDEDESELDPEDSVDEDVPELEDDTDEDDTDGDEADASEDKDDEDEDDSTQDADLPEEDDIDWDYKIPVKIDGEVKHVSLTELRKGFATDQHLSKKGREVSELEKGLKEKYSEKTNQALELGTALSAELQQTENALAKEFHDLETKIQKARDDGDTYELNELKDKRETAQEAYWKSRKKREGLNAAVQEHQQSMLQEQVDGLMATFEQEIQELVPDFDSEAVRGFALEEGVPQEFLDVIMDARVVKFVDDYRKLKQKSSKGSAKRKQVTKAKGVPTKRKSTQSQRKARDSQELRTSVLAGAGNEQSELAFLKSLSKFR